MFVFMNALKGMMKVKCKANVNEMKWDVNSFRLVVLLVSHLVVINAKTENLETYFSYIASQNFPCNQLHWCITLWTRFFSNQAILVSHTEENFICIELF